MGVERRWEEQRRLGSRARHALEHSLELEPIDVVAPIQSTLRLWHYPAFGNHAVWTVFERRLADNSKRLVREVVWDYDHDFARFSDPLEGVRQGFDSPPMMQVRDAHLPPQEYRRLLRDITACPVPLVDVECITGLDGERFGLEMESGFTSARVEWWCGGPKEWADFIAAVTRMREFLHLCASKAR